MAGELIRDTVREDEPVDLLILVYAIHDVRPGQSIALHLSDRCPGTPLAFTVCDQGSAGPFTAARIVSEYLRGGDYQRALMVITEQDGLHYEPVLEPGVEVTLPEGHNAAAVLFEGLATSGPDGTKLGCTVLSSVREFPDTAPDAVPGLLGARLADLLASERPENSVLVLGGGLSKDDADGHGIGRVITAPAGQPCTGVWHELAQGHAEWAEQGALVILADYDRQLRTLCLCAIASR
jgi:4-hydroxymandelate oxidase